MFRIDNDTAAASLPAIPAAGTEKFFRTGNPSIGEEATDVDAWWLNMVQEELRAIVAGGGLTPDKADNAQVYAAIQALIAAQVVGGLNDVTISSPSNGQALIYNGAGWVNGTPASQLGELRKQLLLNDLRDMIGEGSAARLVNAWADPYVDLSLINAGASSGYTFDATNAMIHNPGLSETTSSAGEWNGSTGTMTFTGANVDPQTDARAIRTNDSFTGDFDFYCTFNAPANGDEQVAIYETAEDATFNENTADGGTGSMTKSWRFVNGGTYYEGSTIVNSITDIGVGHDIHIERRSGTIKVYIDDVLNYTFPTTSGNEVRVVLSTGDASEAKFDAVSWSEPGTPTNMIVTSSTFTTLAVPTNGHLIGLVKPVDPVTYNTDLGLDMTRDGGSTWDTLTLEQLDETEIDVNGTPTTVDVVYAEGALTGASETNGGYRWSVSNNKELQLHGAAPEFS